MSQVNGSEFFSNMTICLVYNYLITTFVCCLNYYFETGLSLDLKKLRYLINIIIMRTPLLKCLHKLSVTNGKD